LLAKVGRNTSKTCKKGVDLMIRSTLNFIRVGIIKRLGALNTILREDRMRRPADLFPIALALGAMILLPRAGAQAQDAREEGPTEIEKCRTIDRPGSYKLVNDLTFSGTTGTCLLITARFVTIDLAGFTISGPGNPNPFSGNTTTAIAAGNDTAGIAVRNGSISGFIVGVNLGGGGSIVEGLRIFGGPGISSLGIGVATGIVKGNTVDHIGGLPGQGVGISATGIVTGNYVTGSRVGGIEVGQGSTVIGNTSTDNNGGPGFGINVACPSNVTNNTAVNNGLFAGLNLVLNGNGCNSTNNVAP
jgi:hypothetical protein